MLSLQSLAPGGPETLQLREVPDPVAAAGQVVVRVKACAVNFPDSLIVVDQYQFKPERPFAPGAEVAGIVEAVGEGVSGFSPGDRVFAMPGWGGMAELVAVDATRCFALPEDVPFEAGAAFLMTYGTAYHALVQRAALQPGETVLVTGAAGGVGLAAVEVAKALGARVIAAASSEAKLAVARQAGADEGLIAGRGPHDKDAAKALAASIKAACGPKGADVIVDCVGGALTEAALRAAAWKARLLIVGFPGGIANIPANLLLLKGASAVGVFYGAFAGFEAELDRANMAAVVELYRQGKVRPVISRRFPLAEGGKAIAAMLEPDAFAKVIVDVG